MTKLPPVTLADYAWVGREAMVGWGADYLGKCSIVATRAFTNRWIGDYSISGDHGKVIQYMPFKAFLIEQCNAEFEDVLHISDWTAINSEWLEFYRNNIESGLATENFNIEEFNVTGSALVIEASGPGDLMALGKRSIDVICHGRQASPSILQWCLDRGNYNVRFRGDLDRAKLPFVTAGYAHFRRNTGYSLVICRSSAEDLTGELLDEIARVAISGATIAIKTSAFASLNKGELEKVRHGCLTIKGEIMLERESHTVLVKAG